MSGEYAWGRPPKNQGPLARYLPPLPFGFAEYLFSSLATMPQSGSWVLDPFGAAPQTVVELARAGYRVVVAANNPVSRFLLEMAANPPPESEFRAALAELASARKGEERIEPHLRGLYTTDCARCGRSIMAEAFIWEKDASAPYARIYTCPYCGDNGEHPTTPADIERATISIAGLYRIRALERIAPLNDPDRQNVEEALAVYPPRAVYALFTLINKLEGLALTPVRRRCLEALLLSTCDQANTLWAYPTSRERPRQLGVPPRYRENNVWEAIETSIALWVSPEPAVPLEIWPHKFEQEEGSSGGIWIFEGRLRDLPEYLTHLSYSVVSTALPRPNQAFWTLSALWSGWLWGREAVSPFKAVLHRRRYDWAWHTAALTSAMKAMAGYLPPGTPFLGLIGEVEPGFLKAALIAGDLANFDICDITIRDASLPAYLFWKRSDDNIGSTTSASIPSIIQSAAEEYLTARGEPADYLHLSATAVFRLAANHIYRKPADSETSVDKFEDQPADVFSQTQSAIREALAYRSGFLRYATGDAFDAGHWWLQDVKQPEMPQTDRVEMEVVRYLLRHPGESFTQIDRQICQIFPGLYTPELDLVQACLESYGEQESGDGEHWTIRSADSPGARREEMGQIKKQLHELADRLGFQARGDSPMIWLDSSNQAQYWFYIKASGIFSDIVLNSEFPTNRTLIVLPGSRANLVVYKLRHDPRLNQIVQSGWRFLKFRHLRWLLQTPVLAMDTFDDQLNADPLSDTAIQQRLF